MNVYNTVVEIMLLLLINLNVVKLVISKQVIIKIIV